MSREESNESPKFVCQHKRRLLTKRKNEHWRGTALQVISPFLMTEPFPKGWLKPRDCALAVTPGPYLPDSLRIYITHLCGWKAKERRDDCLKWDGPQTSRLHGDRGAFQCTFWKPKESVPHITKSKSTVPGQPFKGHRRSQDHFLSCSPKLKSNATY